MIDSRRKRQNFGSQNKRSRGDQNTISESVPNKRNNTLIPMVPNDRISFLIRL